MSGRWRGTGWVLLALGLLGAAWATYHLLARMAELRSPGEMGQLLLPALSLVLIVLALALAGVLIRNLAKLIVERKRGILGARLRTKLVFFFLGLVLLPAVVLFSGSAQVIKQTVEALLRTPVEHLTRGREIVDSWMDYFTVQARDRAVNLARELNAAGACQNRRYFRFLF